MADRLLGHQAVVNFDREDFGLKLICPTAQDIMIASTRLRNGLGGSHMKLRNPATTYHNLYLVSRSGEKLPHQSQYWTVSQARAREAAYTTSDRPALDEKSMRVRHDEFVRFRLGSTKRSTTLEYFMIDIIFTEVLALKHSYEIRKLDQSTCQLFRKFSLVVFIPQRLLSKEFILIPKLAP